MRNARLNEAQVGIKIARRNTNNLRYTDALPSEPPGKSKPEGNLARDQYNQTLKGEWPIHPPTNTIWRHPHQGLFFVCGTDAYLCIPVKWMDLSFP